MKQTAKVWAGLIMAARAQGFKGKAGGDKGRQAVLDHLEEKIVSKVTVDGVDVDLKALSVEVSEDQMQVLVTQVDDAPAEEPTETEAEDDLEEREEEEEGKTLTALEINQKVNAIVDQRLGATKGRPSYGTAVTGGETVEDLRYARKIKAGRAVFDTPFEAKLFALTTCRNAAATGTRFGPASDPADSYRKRFDDQINKMMGSSHPRAKAIRAEAKALSSATSNLTAIQFADTLIRLVEEFGIGPRLIGIMQMSEMQMEFKRRTGGVSITYPAENAAPDEGTPTYDTVSLVAKEGMALSQVSNMALRSATIDLGDSIMTEHAQAWAQHIDDAIFKGDGTSAFAGRIGLSHITGAAAPFGTTAGNTGQSVTGGGDASSHTSAHLATLINRIFPFGMQNGAVFTGAPTVFGDTLQRLGGATGGTNQVEFQGVKTSSYASFPYIPNFSMNNTVLVAPGGDAIDGFFGNFAAGMKLGYFGGLEMDVSDQRFWDANAIGIRSTLAWDFLIHDVGDSTNAGPIVAFWQT